MIDADGWTESQIQDFLDLQEKGLIDEDGKLTDAGKSQLGRTGYFPQQVNVCGDSRFGAGA